MRSQFLTITISSAEKARREAMMAVVDEVFDQRYPNVMDNFANFWGPLNEKFPEPGFVREDAYKAKKMALIKESMSREEYLAFGEVLARKNLEFYDKLKKLEGLLNEADELMTELGMD